MAAPELVSRQRGVGAGGQVSDSCQVLPCMQAQMAAKGTFPGIHVRFLAGGGKPVNPQSPGRLEEDEREVGWTRPSVHLQTDDAMIEAFVHRKSE